MTWWRVVGVLSGTSVDAIDVAVADLRLRGDTVELAPLRHAEVPYPADLRAALLGALPPATCTAELLCELDTGIGQAFGAAAATVSESADLVASLGQTIYHRVEGGRCLGTLQLGQAAWIAEATGLPVVSDLRTRDVAAGGHGAPLAVVLDRLLLASPGQTTAALNIGGIANLTIVPPDAPAFAFDTGPGNALLDAAAKRYAGQERDTDGTLAARGTVHADVLDEMLSDPYFAQPPPKTTGREHFHAGRLPDTLDPADLLATLTALTARTIADACRAHGVTRVLASGGGVHNPTLMATLRAELAPADLATTDDIGLPADAKEAYLTALLGFLTWHGVPVDTGTGADGPRVLGAITPGRGPLRLPDPARPPVTRLRLVPPGGSRARP